MNSLTKSKYVLVIQRMNSKICMKPQKVLNKQINGEKYGRGYAC